MANILCPRCGCPIAVDRGIRWHGVAYCCGGCMRGAACEHAGCRRAAAGPRPRPPDVSLPATRRLEA